MADRAPLLAFAIAVSLFSLAGMPLFAGFLTKFISSPRPRSDFLWLAGVAVVASFISLYYYLVVMREMYVSPPESPVNASSTRGSDERRSEPPAIAATFLVGLLPNLILPAVQLAALAVGEVF